MLGMFFTRVFDSKIVNHKGEYNRSGLVVPNAWCVYVFVIPMRFESLAQLLVCQNTCLWEARDCMLDFQKYKAIVCVNVQIILCFDPLREEGQWDLHTLIIIQYCREVEIFNVKAHILRTF